MEYNDELECIVGKIVVGVYVNSDKTFLEFHCINKETTKIDCYCFAVYGGCCSDSYINSLDGFEDILNQEILSIDVSETIEEAFENKDNEQNDCLRYSFVTIKSIKGTATIDFRNVSNGYYDASIRLYNKLIELKDRVTIVEEILL